MGAVGRRRREHGKGSAMRISGWCGWGREERRGWRGRSGVGIAAGKRRGAVRKKRRGRQKHRANIVFFQLESFVETRFNQKLSDLWTLCERARVNFLVGCYFNLFIWILIV